MELLPSYKELKSRMPTISQYGHFIEESRQTVRRILNGTDPRLLLIVGPCSIHDPASAKEFAIQLKSLAESVSSQFFILMRVYCEKPRTATGWKGFLYDPLLNGSNRLLLGIEQTRQLLLDLAQLNLPAATEFLDPLTAFYYDDLITWGSIGARTASSQTHRQLASMLQMPVGFKNGVAGNISAAINGVLAASQPHTHMALHENGWPAAIQTPGNPDAHIVLRGGESKPNYDPSSVSEALARLALTNLPKRLLIDCSHNNSNKKHERQPAVFQSIVHQIIEGNANIRGLMLESHLYGGNQPFLNDPNQLTYGVSITDSCLDWDSTSHLIQWGFHQLVEHTTLQCQPACSSESILSRL
ncbi:Phospho-2-dehydro-3-deoxyheptonate aldolase, Tyr-sensitive [Candidatus Protochlamydia naegleriophila]|uniref:Phospho-2-dehydro-3-deoxyheptonate aldolase n=1 Tax=Candidatus Protochlamydia naegleriophila TaxID=389348 RepID=A0A0U5ESV3_9BACT|nr:3-deoxy-7-phosphoheptulonate synthase [Candidatus Protochlamydia naegleriophila]CUI17249.1 Phospho-2-dehydro-3-deoxyheptonate aldolase, Tyr-sensitive [Candidatus Protochlamydia naegleriophila]